MYNTLYQKLLDNKYFSVPIPPRKKGCYEKGWTSPTARFPSSRKFDDADVGIRCRGDDTTKLALAAIDIDCRDADTVAEVRQLAEMLLGKTICRVGQEPKALLVYRREIPLGKMSTGEYIISESHNRVEILADGQQFKAFGSHPNGIDYRWEEDLSPLNIPYDELPVISKERVDAFLTAADTLLGKRSGGSPLGVKKSRTPQVRVGEPVRCKVEGAREALRCIPADDYETWFRILYALKAALGEEGAELAHEWSATSDKYTWSNTQHKWDEADPVSVDAKTIWAVAKECNNGRDPCNQTDFFADLQGFTIKVHEIDDSEVDIDDSADTMRIPGEIWEARPWLHNLRAYADHIRADSDLLLGVVLARIAAFLPNGTLLYNGLGAGGTSCNMLVNLMGVSGGGKSLALKAGQTIIPCPSQVSTNTDGTLHIQCEPMVDAPLGSGEGIAEAFMGDVGTGKVKKRAQVRYNAFVSMDEGESLIKLTKSGTNTTLQTLRSVFVAANLGALNADEKRRRIVNKGYNMGIVLGFQPATIGPLMADVHGGTPQRFLYLRKGLPKRERGCPVPAPVITLPSNALRVQFPDWLISEIDALWYDYQEAAENGTADPIESHDLLMRCKVAALLRIVEDCYRAPAVGDVPVATILEVTESDWTLAGAIINTSCHVRTWVIREVQRLEHEAFAVEVSRRSVSTAATSIASKQAPQIVEKYAQALAQKVEKMGPCPRGRTIQTVVPVKYRPLNDNIIEFAEGQEWIVVEKRHLHPGPKKVV